MLVWDVGKCGVVRITLSGLVLKSSFLLLQRANFILISLSLNYSRPTAGMNVLFKKEEKLWEELCSTAGFQCGEFLRYSIYTSITLQK